MWSGVFEVLFWLGVAVVLGVGAAAAFVVYFGVLKMRPTRKRAAAGAFPKPRIDLLTDVSRAYGGVVVNDPVRYRFPFFRAQADGRPYAVLLAPTDPETRDPAAPYLVRFEAPLRGGRFVEAWPEGSPYPPLRMSSPAPDVDVGDPAFDAAHVVRTDDTAHARSILTEEVRAALAKLRAVGNGGRVRFDLLPYKLALQKEEPLAEYATLHEFTRHALAAFGEVRSGLEMQAGVEFYDDAPKAKAQAVCPICGAAIAGQAATCLRCRTPHHVECWKYFGMCSMFACGEQRYGL